MPDGAATFGGSEDALVERLRRGDEAAFRHLIGLCHVGMVALARNYVRSHATAEEVAQDTWIAVIEGIRGFEGRSSIKSWIYAILANKARTRAVRDGRTIALSDLAPAGTDKPAVDPDRFDATGHWTDPPQPWEELTPERHLAGRELLAQLSHALDRLPETQRAVVMLRDVEGLDAADACNILGISETNQRVLLHRGRARLRDEIEKMQGAAVPEARHHHA